MSEKLLYWHEAKEKLIRIVTLEALDSMLTPKIPIIDLTDDQDFEHLLVMNDRIAQFNDGVKELATKLIMRMEADTDEQQ